MNTNNTKRNALGRGLGALLQDATTDITTTPGEQAATHSVSEILISQIQANPFQPRTDFKDEALAELAESIRQHGIIQPITVRKMGYDTYQIISGERRTRASLQAGLTKIPAYVRVANDQEMLEMALIENIQREELNPVEIALSYKRLIDECKLSHEEVAERVAKNRTTISNFLRLLKLPDNIQAALKEGKITMGHARAIISLDDPKKQQGVFEYMLSNDLRVRDVEGLVREANIDGERKKGVVPQKKTKNDAFIEYQRNLSSKFDTKIVIKADDKGRGNIKIPFRSQADLQRILDIIAIA